MSSAPQTITPYGTLRASPLTLPLRLVTCLGLARGKITHLLHKLWLRINGQSVDIERRGIKYRLNLSDNTTDIKILISSKIYDKPELDALTAACKNKPFIDVGANIGYYSLTLLKIGCPRVVAIEPNPPTLSRLKFNLSVNNYGDRADIVEMGAGPEAELEFYQTSGLGGSSFVRPTETVPVIKVRTRPLLDILQDQGVTAVGGMKIDVEGFEDQALGPFLEQAPRELLPDCLVVESCHHTEWKTDLKAILLSLGYRVTKQTRSNYIFAKA